MILLIIEDRPKIILRPLMIYLFIYYVKSDEYAFKKTGERVIFVNAYIEIKELVVKLLVIEWSIMCKFTHLRELIVTNFV